MAVSAVREDNTRPADSAAQILAVSHSLQMLDADTERAPAQMIRFEPGRDDAVL